MNILITGGAGFIGSNFVHYMLRKYPDYRIVNLDLLTYAGNLENLKDVEDNKHYTFVKGDIGDSKLVGGLIKEHAIDIIVHFAAESHVDRSIKDPGIFIKSNVMGTQVLLEAARQNHIEKFIQISTDEVYGSLGREGYFTEETPLSPNSPYSASKAGADLLVMSYYTTYGLNVNITRCTNNYGPYQFPEKLIPLMITRALQDQPLPVYGDGKNVRDWIHVQDHCSAIDLVIHNGRPGEIYNIGGHNERTNLEVINMLLQILGKPTDLITFVNDRLGHDLRYAVDTAKINKDLGWEPKYTFSQGLEDTVNWYVKHETWRQHIQTGDYLLLDRERV
ncbi:dTDP-glucose 4,6-dehydratase [Scopulibacillus daqui]|uniref:dTDP-glucose 4,6-dehydratase n=1 Tax=Scopulibacillus daqui TaxID=1469162 RepID=A0ABS2PYC3_9BACL|nr:dTDP-glucose 4,6-dehydratase [Scopulibacillus daqui]MBM7645058.1 dTDP-glucose 4,6-dehydratase [Scopulibacillus daqui]